MGNLSGKLTALKEQYFPADASYSLKDQLGYCSGIFGNCMGQDIATTFSDKFARKYMKIKATNITIFDNIAMAIGFLAGGISGYIMDTPAKPGKLTPVKRAIGIAPLPFAVTSMLLFVVPTNDPLKNFIWKAIFHLIFNVSDIFYDASLNTMSLRIATDTKDRKNFYTVGTFAASLGSMLPGWVIPLLVGSTDNIAVEKKIYFFASLVFCIIGVSSMLIPFFTLNEKVRLTERPEKEKLAWDKQTILAILHNRTFIITEIGTFFEQVRQISYKLLHYIYEDVFDEFQLDTPMGALSGALSYVGLLTVPYLTSHFSSRTILSGGFAYTGVFYSLIGLLGRKRSVAELRKRKLLFGLLIAFAGMPNNAISASKKILVGDSTDYMEWYAEKEFDRQIHAEGFISSVQSVLGNTFNVICTNIKNIRLGKLNYKAATEDKFGKEIPAVQSKETLTGLFKLFVLCGVIGNFLAAITYLFENYNGKRKEAVNAELAEMRARRQLVDAAAQDVAKV